jgi:hypothetical protein
VLVEIRAVAVAVVVAIVRHVGPKERKERRLC